MVNRAWKASRYAAFQTILSTWRNSTALFRRQPRCLSIVPQVMIMIQAILSRQPEGKWQRAARSKIAVMEIDELTGDLHDSTLNRGALFLAGYKDHENQAFRVLEGHALSPADLTRAFLNIPDARHPPSFATLLSKMPLARTDTLLEDNGSENEDDEFSWNSIVKRRRDPRRGNKGLDTRFVYDMQKPLTPWPTSLPLQFDHDMQSAGYRHRVIQSLANVSRSRLSPDTYQDNAGEEVLMIGLWPDDVPTFNTDAMSLNEAMEMTIRQWAVDLLRLTPLPKNAERPSHLLYKDLWAWSPSIFASLDLRGLFPFATVLVAENMDEFDKHAQAHWPIIPASVHGIESSLYVRMWTSLLRRMKNSHAASVLVLSLQRFLRRLHWVPWFGNRRMWHSASTATKRFYWVSPGGSGRFGDDEITKLPQEEAGVPRLFLVLNPRYSQGPESVRVGSGSQPMRGPDGAVETVPPSDSEGENEEVDEVDQYALANEDDASESVEWVPVTRSEADGPWDVRKLSVVSDMFSSSTGSSPQLMSPLEDDMINPAPRRALRRAATDLSFRQRSSVAQSPRAPLRRSAISLERQNEYSGAQTLKSPFPSRRAHTEQLDLKLSDIGVFARLSGQKQGQSRSIDRAEGQSRGPSNVSYETC